MNYIEVQRANSNNRSKLKREDQHWLKENQYKNVGWENVIQLYQKIEEILEKARFEDMSLEELFLEADRVGNKYLTPEEIQHFNEQFSKEVAEVGELIDQQFPDTEIEIIDYGQTTARSKTKKYNRKIY